MSYTHDQESTWLTIWLYSFWDFCHFSNKNSQNAIEVVGLAWIFGLGRFNYPYVNYPFVKICDVERYYLWVPPFLGVSKYAPGSTIYY